VGLTNSSGIAIARSTEQGWPAYAITAATTLLLAFTRLHPLLVMAAGAALIMLAGN
jgi:chromate transporter